MKKELMLNEVDEIRNIIDNIPRAVPTGIRGSDTIAPISAQPQFFRLVASIPPTKATPPRTINPIHNNATMAITSVNMGANGNEVVMAAPMEIPYIAEVIINIPAVVGFQVLAVFNTTSPKYIHSEIRLATPYI